MSAKSWFRPPPAVYSSGQFPIGQIFFATDRSELSAQSLAVLTSLRTYLLVRVRSGPVELGLVGHADHRGSTAHNKGLGRRRIKTIGDFLKRSFSGNSNFSYVGGYSRGESQARQGTTDRNALAADRRVDIYANSEVFRIDTSTKDNYVPGEFRCTYMEWIRADADPRELTDDPRDQLYDFLKDKLNERIRDALLPGHPLAPGKERRWKRKIQELPAGHRVTRILITVTDEETGTLAGTLTSITSRVYYTWGPPQPYIQIKIRKTTRQGVSLTGHDNSDPGTTKTTSFSVPRALAENDPFFFPKSNWKPIGNMK